mmetsp:Transcript_44956/g.113076  ORF Transcript_44956/g.113076 Transcript_44956/m.113076 type:complete len:233 (+) Transcript_44956:257-955(+)
MNSNSWRVFDSSASSQSMLMLLRWYKTTSCCSSDMPCSEQAKLLTSQRGVARLISKALSSNNMSPSSSVRCIWSLNGYISSSQRPSSSITCLGNGGPGPPYQAFTAFQAPSVITSKSTPWHRPIRSDMWSTNPELSIDGTSWRWECLSLPVDSHHCSHHLAETRYHVAPTAPGLFGSNLALNQSTISRSSRGSRGWRLRSTRAKRPMALTNAQPLDAHGSTAKCALVSPAPT